MGFSVVCCPSKLNVKLDSRDARVVKYHEVTNLALESAINAPYETPRTRPLESISLILDRLSDEDWDLDKEMIGSELGDSLVRLSPVVSVKKCWTMISLETDVW